MSFEDKLKSARENAADLTVMDRPIMTDNGKTVQQIDLNRLRDFDGHTFLIREESEDFKALCESVRENGVQLPLLVRPHPSIPFNYEIISGHRRCRAARLAGLTTVPCTVRQMDTNEATILMAESNIQRPEMLPSERAHTYKAWLEAYRRMTGVTQGSRRDLTCGTEFHKLDDGQKSRDVVAQRSGLSGKMFDLYIKLNDLLPDLLQLTDDGKIQVKAAYHLTFLSPDAQQTLLEIIQRENLTLNCAQAEELKSIRKELEVDGAASLIYRTLGLGAAAKPPKAPVFKFAFENLSPEVARKYSKDEELARRVAETVQQYIAEKEERL